MITKISLLLAALSGAAVFETARADIHAGSVGFDSEASRLRGFAKLCVENKDEPAGQGEVRCVYTERVHKMKRMHGVMSPSRPCTEEDFRTLKEWGVRLFRYQIVRDWHAQNNNRNRDEYLQWVDRKISHLIDDVLPWAHGAGIEVVVDLHVAPGGRRADSDMNMFYDVYHAETFLMAWTNIATRCKGQFGIWGYDLINEPAQRGKAAENCDWWTLLYRAARLIRGIDSITPIVVEPNLWSSPKGMSQMKVFDLPDVIYSVHMYEPLDYSHQGVLPVGGPWVKSNYPNVAKGLTRARLELELAPVRDFQERHGAVVYVGEFGCIAWADGAERYLADLISIFNAQEWHWTYHAFREWEPWSVEHEWTGVGRNVAVSKDNLRKQVLLNGLRE